MKRCAVVLTVLAFGCAEEGTTALPGIELVQVFGQEFDGSEGQAIDTSIWNFDVGTGPNGDGWGNNELQYYTDSTDNISLDGEGNLRIRALDIPAADRGDFEGRRYSSARITTLDKFEQEYGRFEARMKMPSGRGLWPAFWMLGANFPEDGWPIAGEIDIVEFNSNDPERVSGALHGPGYNGGASIGVEYNRRDPVVDENGVAVLDEDEEPVLEPVRWDEDFHTYAVEWDPGRITWFVDGEFVGTLNNAVVQAAAESNCTPEPTTLECGTDNRTRWPYDGPFFLLLNFAVGGSFVGNTSPDPGDLPGELLIDYVRVFERVND